jgi:hypothetical protein
MIAVHVVVMLGCQLAQTAGFDYSDLDFFDIKVLECSAAHRNQTGLTLRDESALSYTLEARPPRF